MALTKQNRQKNVIDLGHKSFNTSHRMGNYGQQDKMLV